MLLAIESAITDRLKAALAPMPVDALPARGYHFGHGKGAAVVSLTELSAGGVEDVGASVQGAVATIDVTLFSRTLRDGAGVWDLFEVARRALHSYKPAPGCSPLLLKGAQLDGEADTWVLMTRWQTLVPIAPDLDYDGGPILTRVTFEEM